SEDLHNELKAVLAKIKEFRGEEFKLENAALFEERSRLFFEFAEEFYASFYEHKMNLSQIEMSDLETLTLKSIQNHPEVAVAFSSDWDFWLIDEFQDTSPMQITLLKSLIGSRPRFIVGDPQQSIYLFRGARNEVFSLEENKIVKNNGLLKKLTTNYRSQPELLLFFNQFFSQFDEPFMKLDPKPKLDSTQPDSSDSISRTVDNCVANFFIIPKFEKDESAYEDSSEVSYPNLDRDSSIYSPISKLIIEGVQSGKRFDDYCVLSRTNSELKQIAQAFEQLNIPVQVHVNDSYYQRREILDLLSLLKFLLNPHDNMNFVRLVRSPWLRISDQIIVNNVASRPISYWESLRTAESKHPMIIKLIDIFQRSQERGLFYSLFDFALNEGLIDSSHCHDSTGRRESNIWKFFDILRDEEKTPGFNFMDFAHRTLTEKRSDDENEESDATPVVEPNRVNLMTIHKS
ncbi:MAG: 3'-5' exonuclease, partial [Bdellovibrionales bacterium]